MTPNPDAARFAKVRGQAERDRRIDWIYATVALLFTVYAALHLRASLHYTSPDITEFYLQWYEHIVRYGRWWSLEGRYANYNPPYLYLLSLVSWLDGRLSPIVLIKLAQMPGLIAAAGLFWSICRKLGCSRPRSMLAAWMVLVAPEVFENTVVWGQCDMIHTACLLLMLRLMLARRWGWAMAALGMAIAFKMQAIFVGAVIAALFLAGELPVWTALCVPAAYVAMMVPARMAGRPWKELLLVYNQQYSSQMDLAMHVANPYQLVHHWIGPEMRIYVWVLRGGIVVAGAATLLLVLYLARSPRRLRGKRLPLAMAFTLLMEPYLLPKMHDRYFFSGDVMVLLVAMMAPRMGLAAGLLEGAALMTYYPYLHDQVHEPKTYYVLPVLMATVALCLVGREMMGGPKNGLQEDEEAEEAAAALGV